MPSSPTFPALEHPLKVHILIFLALATTLALAQQPLSIEGALKLVRQNRSAAGAAKLGIDEARLKARSLGSYPPTTLGAGYSSRLEVGGSDSDLFLSQPLDFFGRTSAGRRAGSATILMAEAGYRGTMLGLQSDVLEAYFSAVSTSQLAETSEEIVKVAQGLKDAAQKRFDEGKIAEVQVTRASIELARAKQSALLRRSQRQAAVARLAGALGLPSLDLPLDLNAVVVTPPTIDLTQRPDLLLLNAEVQTAEADAGLARLDNRPELEVQARRSPWNDSNALYGARIQLTLPLYDHGRSRFETQAAKARSQSARARYDDAQKRALSELAAIKVELDASKELVANYQAIVESAQTLVVKSQKGFSEGLGTLTDVLEATRALREIEQELAEAKLRFNLAAVSQYRAAGLLMEVLR